MWAIYYEDNPIHVAVYPIPHLLRDHAKCARDDRFIQLFHTDDLGWANMLIAEAMHENDEGFVRGEMEKIEARLGGFKPIVGPRRR